jgi:hypothetical protein
MHAGQMSQNDRERARWSDQIMTWVLKIFPGVMAPSVQKASLAYTQRNRGYYFSEKDRSKVFRMYIRALKYARYSLTPYGGLMRSLTQCIFGRRGRQFSQTRGKDLV